MNKKLIIVTIILSISILVTGCSLFDKVESVVKGEPSGDGTCSDNGVKVHSFKVVKQNDYYMFKLLFDNTVGEYRIFDMNNIKIKQGKTELTTDGGTERPLNENAKDALSTRQINNASNLKVGDSIDVYCKNKKIKTITIEQG